METRSDRLARDLISVHIHPETRERIPWSERGKMLDRFRGRSDVFGSFTDIFKLGVNPQTEYNTPAGIYSYSIDYIISKTSGGRFNVEFQGRAPYLYIFSVSGIGDDCLIFSPGSNRVISRLFSYSRLPINEEVLNKKLSAIRSFVMGSTDTIDQLAFNYKMPQFEALYNKWVSDLYSRTKIFKDPYLKTFMSTCYLNKGDILNLYSLLDDEAYTIECLQRRFKVNFISHDKMEQHVFPYEDRLMRLSEVSALPNYLSFKDEVIADRVTCDQAFVWCATRRLSKGNIWKWAGMMRRIGLIGAIDHGTGTIHPNEPTQALFFNPSSLRVLDVIANAPPEQYRDFKGNIKKSNLTVRALKAYFEEYLHPHDPPLIVNIESNSLDYAKRLLGYVNWLTHYGVKKGFEGEIRDGLHREISSLESVCPFPQVKQMFSRMISMF